MIPSNLSILDPGTLYSITSDSLDDLHHRDRLIRPENHTNTLSQAAVQRQILSAYLCKLLCSNKYNIDTVLPTGTSSCLHHTKPADQFSQTVNHGSQVDHHLHQPSNCFSCQAVIKGRTDPDHCQTGHSCVSIDKLNIAEASRSLSKFLYKDKSGPQLGRANTGIQNIMKDVNSMEQYTPCTSGATPRPRWCPTQQQLQLLESLFESGTTTPSRDMISEITAHLKQFGSIIEANVFYWFQNRKARAKRNRQKLQLMQQQQIKSSAAPLHCVQVSSSSSSSSIYAIASNTSSSWGSPQSSYNNNNNHHPSVLDPLMGEAVCSCSSSSTTNSRKRSKPSSYNSSHHVDQLVELACINDNTSGRYTKRNKPSLTSHAGQISACDSSSNSPASGPALVPSESSSSTSNPVPINRPDSFPFELNDQVHRRSSPAPVADIEFPTNFEQYYSNATPSTVPILNQSNHGCLDGLVPHHLQYYSYNSLVQESSNSDRAAIALTSEAHPLNDSTLSSHDELETHMQSNTVPDRLTDDQKLQISLQPLQQQQTHRQQHVLNIGELLQFSSQPMVPQLCPQHSNNITLDQKNIINACGDQDHTSRAHTSLSSTNNVMHNELPPALLMNNSTALIHLHDQLGLPLSAAAGVEDAAFQLWVSNYL